MVYYNLNRVLNTSLDTHIHLCHCLDLHSVHKLQMQDWGVSWAHRCNFGVVNCACCGTLTTCLIEVLVL